MHELALNATFRKLLVAIYPFLSCLLQFWFCSLYVREGPGRGGGKDKWIMIHKGLISILAINPIGRRTAPLTLGTLCPH